MKAFAIAAALALSTLAPAFAQGVEAQFNGTPERIMTQAPREFSAPNAPAVRLVPVPRPTTTTQVQIDRHAVPPGV